MTREDIIAMAIEVYGSVHEDDFKFATLVASAEREACAKLVDYWESRQGEHSDAIRARRQA